MAIESTAALRVFSFAKPARVIADMLDRVPTESHEIGESFSQRNPNSRKFDRTTCIFDSGLAMNAGIQEHLIAILEFFESRREVFKLLSNDCEFDVMCSISLSCDQAYIDLDKTVLQRLADCNCDVAFDLYALD